MGQNTLPLCSSSLSASSDEDASRVNQDNVYRIAARRRAIGAESRQRFCELALEEIVQIARSLSDPPWTNDWSPLANGLLAASSVNS